MVMIKFKIPTHAPSKNELTKQDITKTQHDTHEEQDDLLFTSEEAIIMLS